MSDRPPSEASPNARADDSAGVPGGLDSLVVLERFEVGPVELEPRRLQVPYRIRRNGEEETLDLVYRYDEDVFQPADPAARNLATMIGAQVALNYGLFCRQMVFHGPLDDADRRFLMAALENTAREIYVVKFLQPNPFLVGAGVGLRAEKRASYLAADVVFPGGDGEARPIAWSLWNTDPKRHAILSSGGKDSLLSYAVLDEAGFETHPIFLNESGRHWFTALNAFRHFQARVANTARVWTNCDRVFAWMLRHLPFVRPDFARLRADEYPIRLWTVAVFLFGALPLLAKRGIGRLVVGDEFDTTDRRRHRGITHYNGLYDQSRYFDNAQSRYYLRKGWAIGQFSILRPLSELLIQKTLAERYPDLQVHQTSCHATHVRGARVCPCGRCEKCRRIVGMLVALGADPTRCGYEEAQVRHCIESLARREVHQERAGKEHLYHLLARSGVVAGTPGIEVAPGPHPEVMSLRFDAERSPLNALPAELRRPVYGIFLNHAEGALRRIGRAWQAFDLLADPGLGEPYAFELGGHQGRRHSAEVSGGARGYLWGELTWPEAERRLVEVDTALLPVGALEQHGPHLTLDVDAFDADYLVRRVAAACSDPKPLVLPLVPYGVSYHHDDFPGTISISNDTLARLVYEIGIAAARNGVKKLVVVNGHGDNAPTLSHAAQMINRDARIFVCVDTGETSDIDMEGFADTPNDVHAGEIETSTSLAVRPHLVQMDKAAKCIPEFSSRYLNFSSQRGLPWYAYTKRISQSGVMGDPTRASAEKGKKMWEAMVAHLVALVEDLKDLSLDEIFQKRY